MMKNHIFKQALVILILVLSTPFTSVLAAAGSNEVIPPPKQTHFAPGSNRDFNAGRMITGMIGDSLVINLQVQILDDPDDPDNPVIPALYNPGKGTYLIMSDKFNSGWLSANKKLVDQLSAENVEKLKGANNRAYSVQGNLVMGAIFERDSNGTPSRSGPAVLTHSPNPESVSISMLPTSAPGEGIALRSNPDNTKVFGVYWPAPGSSQPASNTFDTENSLQFALWEKTQSEIFPEGNAYTRYDVQLPPDAQQQLLDGKITYDFAEASSDLKVIALNKLYLSDTNRLSIQAVMLTQKSDGTAPEYSEPLDGYENTQAVSISPAGDSITVVQNGQSIIEVSTKDGSISYPAGNKPASDFGLNWAGINIQQPQGSNLSSQYIPIKGNSSITGFITSPATVGQVNTPNTSGFITHQPSSQSASAPSYFSFSDLCQIPANTDLSNLPKPIDAGSIPPVEFVQATSDGFDLYSPWLTSDNSGQSTGQILKISLPSKITYPKRPTTQPKPATNSFSANQSATPQSNPLSFFINAKGVSVLAKGAGERVVSSMESISKLFNSCCCCCKPQTKK